MNNSVELPDIFENKIRYFSRAFHARRWIHYVLGMAAVTCSILVANYPESGSYWLPIPMSGLALIAAIFTGLLTFMSAESKSNNFFRAWRLLESAKASYLLGAKDSAFLAETQLEAEKMISKE